MAKHNHFGELRTDLPPPWVRPTLVVEVEYRQRLKEGLRHAALRGPPAGEDKLRDVFDWTEG